MHHFRNWRAETTSFPFFPKFKRHNSVKYYRTGCIIKAGLYFFLNILRIKHQFYICIHSEVREGKLSICHPPPLV